MSTGSTRRSDGIGAQQSRPGRRRPRWAWLCAIVGTVLVGTSTAAYCGEQYLIGRYSRAVNQQPLLGDAAAPGKNIDGPINLLLVGIDERPAGNPADGSRADSVIVLHIPASHDRAYLMSIPRDTRVQIPAFAQSGYPGGTDKINAAFQYGATKQTAKGSDPGRSGGFQLLANTVRQVTGLQFNGGAIVNFDGFHKVVNAVGGVDMCVDEKVTSIHIGWNIKTGKEGVPYRLSAPAYNDPQLIPGMRPAVYQPGCQHFDGDQALDYARQRELIPDGDYGRQRHQQQFIAALAKKVSSTGLADPIKLDEVIRAAGSAVTFDGNGVDLVDWVFTLKDIKPSTITMIKTNGGNFNSKMINGTDYEVLDENSTAALRAIAGDTIGEFLTAHPDMATSAGTM